jgi:hypothetical protein
MDGEAIIFSVFECSYCVCSFFCFTSFNVENYVKTLLCVVAEAGTNFFVFLKKCVSLAGVFSVLL